MFLSFFLRSFGPRSVCWKGGICLFKRLNSLPSARNGCQKSHLQQNLNHCPVTCNVSFRRSIKAIEMYTRKGLQTQQCAFVTTAITFPLSLLSELSASTPLSRSLSVYLSFLSPLNSAVHQHNVEKRLGVRPNWPRRFLNIGSCANRWDRTILPFDRSPRRPG